MDSLRLIKQHASSLDALTADSTWLDEALGDIGDCRFVLLGEATHGTHDFYRLRSEITKCLIRDKGFSAVAVEADWPDAYRVGRYVYGHGPDQDAERALSGFKRFPTWMWRNADVLDFVGWLRGHNDSVEEPDKKVGFYGMDLYSLQSSMEEVVEYLTKVDPAAAQRARKRYACFDYFGGNAQAYGYFAGAGLERNCETAVVAQLKELQRATQSYLKHDGAKAEDELFYAEQNARVVKNAEVYYRTMLSGRVSSWNLRDSHMVETLNQLKTHLERRGREAKIVVWAHNSHLGDAGYTQMGEMGEHNVGQLIRRQYGQAAYLLGFTTYEGTVTAAPEWDSPAARKKVRPALPESFESLFHQTGISRLVLNLRRDDFLKHALREPRLERAIGVIYRPETERESHYFLANLGKQFDAVIHLDVTRAVEPLELTVDWKMGEPAETYPSAL